MWRGALWPRPGFPYPDCTGLDRQGLKAEAFAQGNEPEPPHGHHK